MKDRSCINEHKVMLALLDNVLHDTIPQPIPKGLWKNIYEELKEQAVVAVPLQYVHEFGLSDEDIETYEMSAGKQVQYYYSVMEAQDSMLQLFAANKLSVVILKGAAASMSYPYPDNRSMGDIDIIVLPEDFDRALRLLEGAGYSKDDEIDIRHVELLSPEGIHVELHHHFSSSDNLEQNVILDEYIYEGIRNLEWNKVSGYDVSILPPLANGLVFLAHMNHHILRGIGLRQIIDWMCYVEQYLTDDFWNQEFSVAADRIGMKRLAIVATAMCKKYLGLQSDAKWYQEAEEEEIVDELMEYILSYGNFGRKDTTKKNTLKVITILRNPIKCVIELQEIGCRTWKALEKYPWLKPFAWIYQSYRWISHGINNGVTLKTFADYTSAEKAETKFLEELGVTKLNYEESVINNPVCVAHSNSDGDDLSE